MAGENTPTTPPYRKLFDFPAGEQGGLCLQDGQPYMWSDGTSAQIGSAVIQLMNLTMQTLPADAGAIAEMKKNGSYEAWIKGQEDRKKLPPRADLMKAAETAAQKIPCPKDIKQKTKNGYFFQVGGPLAF